MTYTNTSLGPAGDLFVDAFTRDSYERFMREWESEMNGYLASHQERHR